MVSARLNECPPHAETKVCSLLNQQDIRINLRRIDPLVLLGLNSREECHGGLNGQEPCSSSHGDTTAIASGGGCGRPGSYKSELGTDHGGSSATRWSRRAGDHDRLSTEGADDPAADPSAAPGNA